MKKLLILFVITVFTINLNAQEEYGEFLDNAMEAAEKYEIEEYNTNMKYFITAIERDNVTAETLPEIFYEKYLDAVYAGFFYEISLSDEFRKTVFEFADYGANHQNAKAMMILGFYYNDWRSAEKDEKKSTHWYQMAAENGNPDAMHFIGQFYHHGILGFEKDKKKSKFWSDKALESFLQQAEQENEEKDLTLLGLSNYYLQKKNYEEAKKWALKTTERGNIYGIVSMASIYMIEMNFIEAAKWAEIAAAKGHPTGMMLMGSVLASTGNFQEAVNWFQKACDAGNQMSCDMKKAYGSQ